MGHRRRPPERGAEGTHPIFFFLPQFIFTYFFLPPPKAAVSIMGAGGAQTGASSAPKGSAEGATPPEGEGNPAEGGCFASFQWHRTLLTSYIPTKTLYGVQCFSRNKWCQQCCLQQLWISWTTPEDTLFSYKDHKNHFFSLPGHRLNI